jgi:hypothetical protein
VSDPVIGWHPLVFMNVTLHMEFVDVSENAKLLLYRLHNANAEPVVAGVATDAGLWLNWDDDAAGVSFD